MECAFCERPLICDACQVAYQPPTADDYGALSWEEETVLCPGCGQVLVCHWCKAPYAGHVVDEADQGIGP